MARGDVLRVELPAPDPQGRREQGGIRPVVAVQADPPGIALPTVMIVPFTSQLGALRFPYTIRVEPSAINGLTQPSVLLVFQLRAIDRRRVLTSIGRLEQSYLDQLEEEMKLLLDLGDM